jgi:hypothetical protein
MLPVCPPGPVHALPQIALDSALRVTYARPAMSFWHDAPLALMAMHRRLGCHTRVLAIDNRGERWLLNSITYT